jgi:hypothetical protein
MSEQRRRQWKPTPEEAAEILAGMYHEAAVQDRYTVRRDG